MSRSLVAATAMLGIVASAASAADDQQSASLWRASKLVGVRIYGPGNTDVGKITDLLLDHDGKAQTVVVGVGGFLGIGEKDVAVPIGQVRFTDQPMTPPPNPAGSAAPADNLAATVPGGGTGAPNGGVAPGATTGLGTPADTMGRPSMPPADTARVQSSAYPDHGSIDMTADQLKSAPAFHFAK